jgi:phage-related protein
VGSGLGRRSSASRNLFIDGLKQGFADLKALVAPIQKAFREIFPPTTSKQLLNMTKNFDDLMKRLKPSPAVVDGLQRTFRGLFSIMSIGWYIVKKLAGVLADVLGIAGKGAGGILSFTGSVGDLITGIQKAVVQGDALGGVFQGLANILRVPIELVRALASAFFGLFGGLDAKKADATAHSIDGVKSSLKPFKGIVDAITGAFQRFVNIIGKIQSFVAPIIANIGHAFSTVGSAIADGLKHADFDKIFAVLNTTVLTGLFLGLRKGLSKGLFSGNTLNLSIDSLKHLSDTFKALTGNLGAMQKNIQAHTLLAIAGAIVILAAGVTLLSTIDPKKLGTAMSAVAVGLGQLVAAMALLSKVAKGGAFLTLPVISLGMIELAGAVTILAVAINILSKLSWEGIAKGLTGVAGALVAVSAGMKLMGPEVLTIGPGLIAVGIAMNTLAVAMKILGSFSWDQLAKGIAGMAGAMVALGLGLKLMGPDLIIVGPGLVAAALGVTLLGGAVSSFSRINWETMYKGLIGIGASLVVIGTAIEAIPPSVGLQAAGLVILAVALAGIGGAIKTMGHMDLKSLGKGIAALAGTLAILAVGLEAMSGTLGGSAALLIAAGALAILAPTLAFLGTLSMNTIGKGLLAIAGVLTVLGVAGLVGAEAIGALGIALIPFGIAAVAAGAGVYLLGKGLSFLGGNGAKGIAVMIAAITAFIAVIPEFVSQTVKGFLQGVIAVSDMLPDVLNSLARAVTQSAPQLAMAIGSLVDAVAQVIIQGSPKLIKAGGVLLLNLLQGIDQNISAVLAHVTSIVLQIVAGLTSKAPELVAAGAKMLVAFLSGIAKHLADVVNAAYKIEAAFVEGLAKSIPRLVAAGVKVVTNLLDGIATGIPKLVKSGVHIVTSLINGISSQFGTVAATATRFVVRFFNAFGNKDNAQRMVNAGLKAAIHVLQGIAAGMRQDNNVAKIVQAAQDIGLAIVEGIGKGLASLPKKLGEKLVKPVEDGYHGVKHFLGIHSPSKAFEAIGRAISDGLSNGLSGVADALNTNMVAPFREVLHQVGDLRAFSKYLGSEFKDGLLGGLFPDKTDPAVKQIEDTFTGLKAKMTEEHKKLRDKIKEDQDKLQQLLQDPKKNAAEIAQVRAAINANSETLALSQFRSQGMIKTLDQQRNMLEFLAQGYEQVTANLETAKQGLADLIQQRDQAVANVTQQYSALPDVSSLMDAALADAQMTAQERADAARKKADDDRKKAQIDQVALYKKALQDQIVATQKYMDTLNKLRSAGLDDVTYQKLLDQGLAGQDFASALLAKGKDGIAAINQLDAQLAAKATNLANQMAAQMYNAGIYGAAGIVKGLTDKQSEIEKAMEDIAKSVVRAIRSQLGIKSPSRVLAEVGKYAVQGLVDGIKASTNLVTSGAANVGDAVTKAFSDSLSQVGDHVQNSIDVNQRSRRCWI